jgi:hypothetical protein
MFFFHLLGSILSINTVPASVFHPVKLPCKDQGGAAMKTQALGFIMIIVFMGIRAVPGNAEGVDWPRWRGPNGDGISKETDWNPAALAGDPKILWNVNVGVGYSNVAIRNNRLYTTGMIGREFTVSCLDAETGATIWQTTFGDKWKPQSTPSIDGKYVYVLGGEGLLMSLNSKTGKVQWSKEIASEYDVRVPMCGLSCSPVIVGNLIILNANTSGMALNKKTGVMLWSSGQPLRRSMEVATVSTMRQRSCMNREASGMRLYPVTRAFMGWMWKRGPYPGSMTGRIYIRPLTCRPRIPW